MQGKWTKQFAKIKLNHVLKRQKDQKLLLLNDLPVPDWHI